jgi:hypothetical protein
LTRLLHVASREPTPIVETREETRTERVEIGRRLGSRLERSERTLDLGCIDVRGCGFRASGAPEHLH